MTRRDFESADALTIGDRLEEFLATENYVAALQREVDVAMAHAELRKVMGRITRSN